MPTKGASNKYVGTLGSNYRSNTNKINYKYAKDFNKSTKDDHYKKHKDQFGVNSSMEYVAKAINFANNIDKKYKSVVDYAGKTYKYDPKRNRLVIVDKNGIVVTFYKPKKWI